jgi:hypothetical protein
MSRWKAASSAVRPIKIGQMTDVLNAVVMDVPAFHAREKAPFPVKALCFILA